MSLGRRKTSGRRGASRKLFYMIRSFLIQKKVKKEKRKVDKAGSLSQSRDKTEKENQRENELNCSILMSLHTNKKNKEIRLFLKAQ